MASERNLSVSQNFFRRESFVRRLVATADIATDDLVVEIGPGKGLITAVLSETARRVLAVELDSRLVNELKTRFSAAENVEIIHTDFISWALPETAYKVFSNIPFNMTADIVRKLTATKQPPTSAYLVLQRQAALRYVGQIGEPNTQVSILLKPWFDIEIMLDIPASEFIPMPRVSIVLARFKRRDAPLVHDDNAQLFRDFVVYGYNQWKPTLLEGLSRLFSNQQRRILSKDIRLAEVRPTQATITQWLRLFEVFLQHVPTEKQRLVFGAEQKLNKVQSTLQKQHRTRKPF